jgi:hypothetical protein
LPVLADFYKSTGNPEMPSGKVSNCCTYITYPDGQVLPMPLSTANYQWSNMIFQLKNNPALQNSQESQTRFIRTAISYMCTNPIGNIVKFIFKFVVSTKIVESNIRTEKYCIVNFPKHELPDLVSFGLILRQLQTILRSKEVIGCLSWETKCFRVLVQSIRDRRQLAFLLSLVPSGFSEFNDTPMWHTVLNAIADIRVSLSGPILG